MLSRLFILLAIVPLTIGAQVRSGALTSTAEVRKLDRKSAAKGLSVELRGVVTASFSRESASFIVDDGVSAIFVSTAEALSRGLLKPGFDFERQLPAGTLVEVSGITSPGSFAPVILPQRIRRVGTAPLPEAKVVAVADLQTGRFDCERVRVRGVVQHAEVTGKAFVPVRLALSAVGGHFAADVVKSDGFDPKNFVDAEVEMTGVALTFYNERAELLGARIQIDGLADMTVLRPAPPSPFDAPAAQLDELLAFSPEGPLLHRKKVTGTVTVCRPGSFFYLQEGDRAVRVNTRESTELLPGDRVEVSGFIEIWDSYAEIREAVFRTLGRVSMPMAEPVTLASVLTTQPGTKSSNPPSHLDGRRVTLRGRLVKVEDDRENGRRLSLDCDGHVVFATLANDGPRSALERLVPGSDVSVTGVCRVQLAVSRPVLANPAPISFQLLVQSPDDIAVLRVPSWWTPQRLWFFLGGTVVVLALALTWAWLLRRRVAQRSAQLEVEIGARRNAVIEFDVTLRERKRLAADLHDTLEQALTGLAFQLEAVDLFRADEPERSIHHFHLARQFLERSREDVRRSVWNLRAQGLEGKTLLEALQEMITLLTEGQSVRMVCESTGEPFALPDFIASNLLLLAQESVTNALKHAKSTTITVKASFDAEEVSVSVMDDGQGFDLSKAPGLKEGHFGLQGMRERIKRLGGGLVITSTPGSGTRIAASVPRQAFNRGIEG